MILAGIDIGTNTLRLLIADADAGTFRKIFSDRRVARLGQDLERTGMLSAEAEERSIAALSDFSVQIRQFSAVHTTAVGTSAVRNASNAAEFIDRIKQRTGIAISVVTGEEEARLTLKGVERTMSGRSAGTVMVFDIGGGSTEIIIDRPNSVPTIESLPLGAVYLTERFIQHDPPLETEVAALRAAVKNELRIIQRDIAGLHNNQACVGTGGTITTLAAIDQRLTEYDPDAINNYDLSRTSIDVIVQKLSRTSRRDARNIEGLEPGREDIILAGAIIAQELLAVARCSALVVSDWGLREGIVLELYDKLSQEHTL